MNTQASSPEPPGVASPGLPSEALPEDVAQALNLIASILSLNEDPSIQPGQLTGMSVVLSNAEKVWREMRADCPAC